MESSASSGQSISSIEITQQDDILRVAVTWGEVPPRKVKFRLRQLATRQIVAVPAKTEGHVSTAFVDLAGIASFEVGDWALRVRNPWAGWKRVGKAVTISAAQLSEVVNEHGIARFVATGASAFVVRTGETVPEVPQLMTVAVSSGRDFHWQGLITGLDAQASDVCLVAVERTTGTTRRIELRRERRGTGLLVSERLDAHVPWSRLEPELASDWLDLSIDVTVPGAKDISLPLPRPGIKARIRHRLRPGRALTSGGVGYFGPFYTFKAHRLAIHVTTLSTESDAELRRVRRWLRLRRLLRAGRPVWVIGETGYKAQDTGLEFFRHVRAHHPEIDARFVIDADSPDRTAAEQVGPVLLHGSPEHVRAVLLARRIVGSHHPEYLYPVRTADFKRAVHAPKVFLQHGVLGTKWMANLYGKGNGGFETDCFLVSSPFEKRIVRRDFGYPSRRVVVTGLTRFDTLLEPSEPEPQLLVIPTWRDWIKTEEDFADSEFLSEWLGLLRSEQFREVVSDAGWRVRMILHPNFRQFAPLLQDAGIEVIHQGQETVQSLLRQSQVLLTDYSSVGFDFALQRRTVVYFQFDRPRFLGPEGSHMDLDRVLPGAIAFSAEDAAAALALAAAEPQVSESAFAKARRFFPAMDTNSSARAFAAVKAARGTFRSRILTTVGAVMRLLRRRLRYSRLYGPFVRNVYRAARLLPLQRDRVVFECGLGKRFGDSPRAIYEALCETHPALRKTWVLDRTINTEDDNTDTVPRLTVRYFVALARARYLVGNQSFPHYVRMRRGQVFVQTWHGTPIKRMARDQLEVVGRDAGYVERAVKAAAQWTVLVSPNSFTTRAMRSAFGFSGEALEVGYPRNDVLHGPTAEAAARAVRHAYGLPPDRRIVLFAPTFRDRALDQSVEASPTGALGLSAWASEFGTDATLLIRRHVLDGTRPLVPAEPSGSVIDVTDYPDVQHLLAAADVLVTDYSSLFFDYLNVRRPMVFFAPDLADYRDVVRGFYLDYDADLPGPVTTDSAEARGLIREALDHGGFDGYDLDAFAEKYCPLDDGHASERVVAHVFGPAEG